MIKQLTQFSQVGALVVAIVYVLGLLIVNIDLASYGIVSLSLARPEYLLAGGLFAFLMSLSLAVLREIERIYHYEREIGAPRIAASIISALNTGVLILVMWLVGGRFEFRGAIIKALEMLVLAFSLQSWLGKFTRELAPYSNEPLRTLVNTAGSYFAWQAGYIVYSGLIAIFLYANYLFPLLASQYGGGSKPLVTLYLSDRVPFRASDQIPASKDERVLGPLQWIADNGSTIVVAKDTPAQGYLLNELFPRGHGPAIVLDKRMISAAVYGEKN